MKENP